MSNNLNIINHFAPHPPIMALCVPGLAYHIALELLVYIMIQNAPSRPMFVIKPLEQYFHASIAVMIMVLKYHSHQILVSETWIVLPILRSLHYSKEKFEKTFPEVSPICKRCTSEEGKLTSQLFSLFHWDDIIPFLSEALSAQIGLKPVLIILEISKDVKKLKQATGLLTYGFYITVKKLIHLFWKNKYVLTLK